MQLVQVCLVSTSTCGRLKLQKCSSSISLMASLPRYGFLYPCRRRVPRFFPFDMWALVGLILSISIWLPLCMRSRASFLSLFDFLLLTAVVPCLVLLSFPGPARAWTFIIKSSPVVQLAFCSSSVTAPGHHPRCLVGSLVFLVTSASCYHFPSPGLPLLLRAPLHHYLE
ncbi:hypothetical protein B0H19DRAFT_1201413 [Mycena capillaripes]|nr:hypothetical protein B0H19DRAFT_1201413 [Mycena capillaripes]